MPQDTMLTVLLAGYLTGLSLIVAIGAQNAFVLRAGLLRQHVLPLVLICAVSDAVLIWIGVTGSSQIAKMFPNFASVMRWGGAAFLFGYGARSALSAWRGQGQLEAKGQGGMTLLAAVTTCAALTWLNPHVYLDTLVLLGAISSEFAPDHHLFGLGAVLASFSFFTCLGFGARFLQPLFANPTSWRILDGAIALIMWSIAISLVRGI